jgi:hypothetical protein
MWISIVIEKVPNQNAAPVGIPYMKVAAQSAVPSAWEGFGWAKVTVPDRRPAEKAGSRQGARDQFVPS